MANHLVVLLTCVLFPLCMADFTFIMPDSQTLADGPSSAAPITDPNEQEAVYEIMDATGNRWARSIPDVCHGRWHGIDCDLSGDGIYHVVSLSFGDLSGDTGFPLCGDRTTSAAISPAVVRLRHLRGLIFSRCFSGNPSPIPAFIGQLGGATLRTLVLRENGHVGPISSELGNLTSLEVLDLHGNNLVSSIPESLTRLTRLRLLDLSGNRLAGELQDDLSFPSLKVFDVSHNLFHGQIPTSIGNCTSLIKLDMSSNRLTGPIPDSICNLKSLILLDLSHNLLAGPLPESLAGLSSLQALILNGNFMKTPTTIPEPWFEGMKKLVILVLSNMGLEGVIPESMARLPSIRVLHLDGNRLNGSIPRSFSYLDELSELRLDSNWLTGPVPLSKEVVWRMGKKLRLHNNFGLCYEAAAAGDGAGEEGAAESLLGLGPCAMGGKVVVEAAREKEHLQVEAPASGDGRVSSRGLRERVLELRMLVMVVASAQVIIFFLVQFR